jgi:O-antigen/teichoic acid export membrane protein
MTVSDSPGAPKPAGLKRFFGRKSVAADVALLLAGAGGAQAVMVLSAPLLSRLYSPAEFAGLALLTSAVGIVSRFSSFKYESAIATGRNRPEMGTLAALATWVLMGFTIAAVIIPVLCFPLLEARLGMAGAITFCICLPITVFFDGMIQIVITWAVRWRELKAVSTNDLLRNGSSVLTQLLAGVAKVGVPGLMLGQTVGTVFGFWALTFRGTTAQLLRYARSSSWHRRRVVAQRFRDFPIYQMPKATLNALARNAPPLLISAYYSASATGLFYLAFRLTALPAQLIALSLGRILMQRFATLQNVKKQSLLPLLIRSTIGFTILGAPIVLVAALFGPQLFRFFLGARWESAGYMAAWTALWSATLVCGTPSQMSLLVQRKNKVLLAIEAAFILPRLVPFPFFAAKGDILSAVAYCCVASTIYNIAMIACGLYYARREGGKLALNPA